MRYRILVVDDSDIIRSVVKKALSMAGLEIGAVFEAADGSEALDMLKREWVDVVFADINMPKMDGLEMMRRMVADPLMHDIPVVIISSDQNQAKLAELTRLGAHACLKKPFRPEDFRGVIEDLFKKGKEK